MGCRLAPAAHGALRADRAARGWRRIVAVLVERHAEVVPVAVRPCLAGRTAARQRGVPAVLHALAALQVDGDDPGVGAADGEVHVEAVAPLVCAADADGAA